MDHHVLFFDLNSLSERVLLALGEVECPARRRVDPVEARDAVPLVHEGEVEQEAGRHEQQHVQQLDLGQRYYIVSLQEGGNPSIASRPIWVEI